MNSIKVLWEVDLGEDISEELWEEVLGRVHKSSICVKHGLVQCKIIHRAHLTKVRLSKIYPDVDPTCDRCRQAPASHAHMFWSCPVLHSFWREIFETLSKVTRKLIEPNPMIALFGVCPSIIKLSSLEAALVAFVTLLARRMILFRWKSPTPPSHALWIKEVLNFVKLEKIRCVLRGSLRKFHKTWDPFFAFVHELNFSVIPE